MADKDKIESLKQIEETQQALRASIEQSKDLAAKTQELIEQHRQELQGE